MSSVKLRVLATRASAALAVAALAACSTETTSPTAAPGLRAPNVPTEVLNIGDGSNSSTARLTICKWSSSQTPVTLTITKVSGPGTLSMSGAQVFTPTSPLAGFEPYVWESCVLVLNDGAAGVTTISVTETVPPGTTLDVLTGDGEATTFSDNLATANITIGLSNTQEARIFFKNSGTPDEPPSGCTYTQGYWKTHVDGKKLDPTWSTLANGPNTIFFNGNANAAGNGFFGTAAMNTWLKVFNTPVNGDRRIALAYQFMAAYLNSANGTSLTGTGVQAAFDGANAYFLGGSATAAEIDSWQSTLTMYNEGSIGPGHCD